MTCRSYKDTSKQTEIQVIVRTFTNTIRTFSTKIGQTVQLSPTISDSDTSKFIFNNLTSNIIDVSANGLVTGKIRGMGRVLVREEYSGAQIEYTINVLDNVAPVITASPTSSNYAKNINVTIKATDNSGELNSSNSYQYQLSTSNTTAPTGTWSTYTNGAAVNIGQNLTGTYYLWVRQVLDKDNNISQQGGTKVGNYHVFGAYKFDNTAPTKPTLTNSSGGKWTNTGVTISAYSDDSGSGVEKIQYSFDQKTWYDDWGTLTTNGIRSTISGTWTAQRNNTLYARAIDKMGNISEISTTLIRIDKTLPTLTVTQSTTSWTKGNVTLTIKASDAQSGLNKVTVNGTAVTITNGQGTYQVSQNGTYKIIAIDKANNPSTKDVSISNIDKTVPALTVTQSTTSWTNQNVTLTIKASDAQSGLNTVTVNGTAVTITNGQGTYQVAQNGTYNIVAIDKVNNPSTKSVSISNIDKTAPTVSLGTNGGSAKSPAEANAKGTIVSKVTAEDKGGSSLKSIHYVVTTATSAPSTGWTGISNGATMTKTGLSAGTYYLHVRATDYAGNTTIVTSNKFTVVTVVAGTGTAAADYWTLIRPVYGEEFKYLYDVTVNWTNNTTTYYVDDITSSDYDTNVKYNKYYDPQCTISFGGWNWQTDIHRPVIMTINPSVIYSYASTSNTGTKICTINKNQAYVMIGKFGSSYLISCTSNNTVGHNHSKYGNSYVNGQSSWYKWRITEENSGVERIVHNLKKRINSIGTSTDGVKYQDIYNMFIKLK